MTQFGMHNENLGETSGPHRRSFLRQAAGASIAVAAVSTLTSAKAQAQPGALTGPRQQFQLIRQHEGAHVTFLVNALGAAARPRPNFQNLQRANLRDFLDVAMAFENTGCGAYLGAAPHIQSSAILGSAASIALIEGRHAGFINSYRSRSATINVFAEEQSFERALTIQEVSNQVAPFIQNLNGGPPLTFSTTTESAQNDIDILNFALALEYLERDFYDINVPLFF